MTEKEIILNLDWIKEQVADYERKLMNRHKYDFPGKWWN